MLYQDLIRSKQLTPRGFLPPVLPLVLYNGESRWTAAQEVGDLIEAVPGGLETYRPHLRYLLLDEQSYQEAELATMRNLASAVFRLEKSRGPDDVRRVVETLIEWLETPEQSELRRTFVAWLRQVLFPRRLPATQMPELEDMQEVSTMLAERVQEWTRQWREEGRQEGRLQGREEILKRQLELRFGPLEEHWCQQLSSAAADHLLVWGERVLTAATLEEVFA